MVTTKWRFFCFKTILIFHWGMSLLILNITLWYYYYMLFNHKHENISLNVHKMSIWRVKPIYVANELFFLSRMWFFPDENHKWLYKYCFFFFWLFLFGYSRKFFPCHLVLTFHPLVNEITILILCGEFLFFYFSFVICHSSNQLKWFVRVKVRLDFF